MLKVGDKVMILSDKIVGKILEIEDYSAPYGYRIAVEGYSPSWFGRCEVGEVIDYNDLMKEVINGP